MAFARLQDGSLPRHTPTTPVLWSHLPLTQQWFLFRVRTKHPSLQFPRGLAHTSPEGVWGRVKERVAEHPSANAAKALSRNRGFERGTGTRVGTAL